MFHRSFLNALLGLFLVLLCAENRLAAQDSGEAAPGTEENESANAPIPDIKQLEDIIDAQLSAIRNQDLNRAYFAYTSEDFRKTISFNDFQRLVTKFSALSKNKSFTFKGMNSSSNIVSVSGLLTASDGETLEVEYDLIKEGDDWKILGLELFKLPEPPKPKKKR